MIAPGVAVYGENEETVYLTEIGGSRLVVKQNGIDLEPDSHQIIRDIPFDLEISFPVPVLGDGGTKYKSKGDKVKMILAMGSDDVSYRNELKLVDNQIIELFGQEIDGVRHKVGEASFEVDSGGRTLYANILYNGEDAVFDGTLKDVVVTFTGGFIIRKNHSETASIPFRGTNYLVVQRYFYTLSNKVEVNGNELNESEIITENKGVMDVTIEIEKRENLNLIGQHKEADLSGTKIQENFDGNGYTIEDSCYVNGVNVKNIDPNANNVGLISLVFPQDTFGKQIITYKRELKESFLYEVYYDTGATRTSNHDTSLFERHIESGIEHFYFVMNLRKEYEYQVKKLANLSVQWIDKEENTFEWVFDVNLPKVELKNAYFTLERLGYKETLLYVQEQVLEVDAQGKEVWKDGNRWTDFSNSNFKYQLGDLNNQRRFLIGSKVKPEKVTDNQILGTVYLFWDGGAERIAESTTLVITRDAIDKKFVFANQNLGVAKWQVKVKHEEIDDLTRPIYYDFMVFDSNFENRIRQEFLYKENSNYNNANILLLEQRLSGFESSPLTAKEVLKALPIVRDGFGQKLLANSFEGVAVQKQILPIKYENKYVGDLLIVTGPKGQDWDFSYNSYVRTPFLLQGASHVLANAGVIYDGRVLVSKMVAQDMSKQASIFEKVLLPATSAEKFTQNPLAENIAYTHEGDIESFNYKDNSMMYMIRINPYRYGYQDGTDFVGTKEAMGKMTITENLPTGWVFAKVKDDKDYLIFKTKKGQKVPTEYYTEPYGEVLDSIGGMSLKNGSIAGKNTATFEFSEDLTDSYVMLIRIKPSQEQWKKYYKKVDEYSVNNTLVFSAEKALGEESKNVNTKIFLRVLNKTVEEKGDALQWNIDFNPLELQTTSPEIWLEDTLPQGIRLQFNPDGSLRPSPSFRLQQAEVNTEGSLRMIQDVDLVAGQNLVYQNGKLRVKLPKDGKAYRFSYITDITATTNLEMVNRVRVDLSDLEIAPAEATYHYLAISGKAKYDKTEKDKPVPKVEVPKKPDSSNEPTPQRPNPNVEVGENEIPQSPSNKETPENKIPNEEVSENDIPEGSKLPNTAGIPMEGLIGFGLSTLLIGARIKIKVKK